MITVAMIIELSDFHRNNWLDQPLETMNGLNQRKMEPLLDAPLQQGAGYLTPFQRTSLQKSLMLETNPAHRLRIEIMLLGDEGKTQTEICKALACSQATARQWLLMARLGEAHRWKDISIGRPKQVNEAYLQRLKFLIDQGPRAVGYSFQTWTGEWLGKHLEREFGFKLSARHVNRLLKKMGLSTRTQKIPASRHPKGLRVDGGSDRLVIRDLDPPSSQAQSPDRLEERQ
jgi:transposase